MKPEGGAKEMMQWLGALAALTTDPGLRPSTHMVWPTTVYNSDNSPAHIHTEAPTHI